MSLMAGNARANPVPLFSLQKLVTVRTEGYETATQAVPNFLHSEEPKRSTFGSMMASLTSISSFAGIGSTSAPADYAHVAAQISVAAQGGYEGNEYFALYNTNSTCQKEFTL